MGLKPPLPSTAALKYRGAMLVRFPALIDWGVYNCRNIAGTTTPSQHAWANAVDLHPLTKSYGDKAYAYILAHADSLSVAHVLWQVPDHYDHIHADFYPQGTGTPPCMGGALTSSGGKAKPTQATAMGFHIPNPLNVPGDIAGGIVRAIAPYLKIAAGGILMLAGLGVVLAGATGTSNQAGQAVSAYLSKGRSSPSPSPAPRSPKTAPAPRARVKASSPARRSTSGPRTVTIGGERIDTSRLSPRARAQLEGA